MEGIVPKELSFMLIDFMINYKMDRPDDIIKYAAKHFKQKEIEKRQELNTDTDEESSTSNNTVSDSALTESEDEEFEAASKCVRRMSVYAEEIDPELENYDEKIVYPKTDEEKEFLKESLKDIFLFMALEENQINEIVDAMMKKEVIKDDVIISQGDDGDYFYVIASGIYDIYVRSQDGSEEEHKGRYEETGYFGELALLYKVPRAATIKAATSGFLWALDRLTFRKLVVKSTFKKRQEYDNLLKSVHILQPLTDYERMTLCDAVVTKIFTDEIIFSEEGEADGMYFILEGKVAITKMNKETHEDQLLKELGHGHYFGELALINKRPRAATVSAVGKVRTAFIDVFAFERLLGPCLSILERNAEKYTEEMKKMASSQKT